MLDKNKVEDMEVLSELLDRWGQNMKGISPIKEGTKEDLDITALNKMEETKILIRALKAIGVVSNKQLFDMGFVAAGMVLRFK